MERKIKNYKIVSGISKTSGKKWYAIELEFDNGYTKLVFLNSQERFILGINEE